MDLEFYTAIIISSVYNASDKKFWAGVWLVVAGVILFVM